MVTPTAERVHHGTKIQRMRDQANLSELLLSTKPNRAISQALNFVKDERASNNEVAKDPALRFAKGCKSQCDAFLYEIRRLQSYLVWLIIFWGAG